MNTSLFALQSTNQKWAIIVAEMKSIQDMDTSYELRRRFNPHHPDRHKREELQRLRKEQYTKWAAVKQIYTEFRDELSNTCDDSTYVEYKTILEKILMQDFDQELRKVIQE